MLKSTVSPAKIPPKIQLLFAVLGLAGLGIVLLATSNFGAGLSPDSIGYIAAARNLAAGNGFLWYNGDPIDFWPPLYPIILAISIKFFGIDPLLSTHVINSFIFGLTIYLTGLLVYRYIENFAFLAIFGTVYILFSISLFSVSIMAWSEPPFILFVVLFLLTIDLYLEKGSLPYFMVAAIAALLACFTRYIGVALTISGMVAILFFAQSRFKEKLIFSSIFGLVSFLPLSLWLNRNYMLTGTLTGYRDSSKYSIYQNVLNIFNVILGWFFPSRLLSSPYYRIGIFLFLVILITLFFVFVCKYWSVLKQYINKIFPIIIFISIYLALLVIGSKTISYLDNRFLAPIFIPIVIVLLFVLDKIFNLIIINTAIKKLGLIFILSSMIFYSLGIFVNNFIYISTQGGDSYNSVKWRKSETVKYIADGKLSSDRKIFSDDPYAIYFFTGIVANNLTSLQSQLSNSSFGIKPVYIILFHEFDLDGSHLLANLNTGRSIDKIAHFKDGSIYMLRAN
jgi:hypothetical protein